MFKNIKKQIIMILGLLLLMGIASFFIYNFDNRNVNATTLTCADSDGGKDYYVKGYVSIDGGVSKDWDMCAYNSSDDRYFLYENYCQDNQPKTRVYSCTNGCQNGACVEEKKFVTITYPNGGEKLNSQETYDITWNSQGIDYVSISLIAKDNASQGEDLAYKIPASLGKYSWKVGASHEGEYKIYIKDDSCSGGYWPSKNLYDYSDEYFTIIRDPNDKLDIDFEVDQVEGFDAVPDIIPYNALFTVKWNAPGARYCDAGGDALPLSEEDIRTVGDSAIENWPDLTLLPSSGTKTLYARMKTFGYVTPLTISLQCDDMNWHTTTKKLRVDVRSYEFPLNQPASGAISVSSKKVEAGEPFTVTIKGYDSDGLDKLLVGRPNVGWISRLANGATSSEANFIFSESKPGIYVYDGDIIGTRPNGSRDQIRTNPPSVEVEVIDAGKEIIDCAKEYGEDYWCGNYEDWQNECQGEGNTISLEQSNKACKGSDWPLSYCVTCKSVPPEFYYPRDGATIHTINPLFIVQYSKMGQYYQVGVWEGNQALSEDELITWINIIRQLTPNISQEGPIGTFSWNKTYTAGIRECQNDSFTDCGDWTDLVTFNIKPGTVVYESDQGKDYYAKGSVAVDSESMYDKCLYEVRKSAKGSKVLLEYYSTGEANSPVAQIQYRCPYGCAEGRCLKEGEKDATATCVDSDNGKDYFVKGKLSYENNPYGITEEQDVCLNKDYLLERFCGNPEDIGKNREKHFCPNGCKNGICIKKEPSTCFPDGTLIKLPDEPKVYVIKNCKKKWIKSPKEFKKEGYKWKEIQETSSDVVNAYADYLETQAKLLRAIGKSKVYRIVENKKLLIPDIRTFKKQKLSWEDVEDKTESELNQYPRAKLLKAKNETGIYYITESGLRRQVPNQEVFESYGNKWQDVVEVDKDIIESYEICNLIKPENSYRVYKLEGNTIHWIKTTETFNRLGYDWTKIAPVNQTEISAYREGPPIE